MNAFPAALGGMIAALGVGMTMVGRGWPDRPKHRGPRRRRADEYVPAAALIPAFTGAGWPTTAFAHCVQCRATVPVLVHGDAYRCDAHGHVTTRSAL